MIEIITDTDANLAPQRGQLVAAQVFATAQ